MRLFRIAWAGLLGALILVWGCGVPAPRSLTAHVAKTIDGDTAELSTGERVRYLGIDTPESRRRRGGEWIYDPEPFAVEAANRNRELVEGRDVRLELDMEPRDKYGRLLAYVYVGEECVNETLLREGLARPLFLQPNMKYAERFRDIAREARLNKRGIWSRGP